MTAPNWAWNLPLNLISKEADKYGLRRDLLAAMVLQETSGKEYATRYERGWKYFLDIEIHAKKNGISQETEKMLQATSWGPLQIMGSVARELGYTRALPALSRTDIGLQWGCKKLKTLVEKYPSLEDAISSYNQGSPRRMVDGRYQNQYYVENVLKYMSEIGR